MIRDLGYSCLSVLMFTWLLTVGMLFMIGLVVPASFPNADKLSTGLGVTCFVLAILVWPVTFLTLRAIVKREDWLEQRRRNREQREDR